MSAVPSPGSEKGSFANKATGETLDVNEEWGCGVEPEFNSSRKPASGPLRSITFNFLTFSSLSLLSNTVLTVL